MTSPAGVVADSSARRRATPSSLLLLPLAGDVLTLGPLGPFVPGWIPLAVGVLTAVLAGIGVVSLVRSGGSPTWTPRWLRALAVLAVTARAAGLAIILVDRSDSSLSWFATPWLFLLGGAVLAGLGVVALGRPLLPGRGR
ncbi:hypothetical protein AU359_00142 [Micrococcus luteus]|uniref:hypothetical protein n=1 Tax=Micrococcus luteus TaxID=1270 RepID=UPI00076381B6|nr:hypothetical protein [Micrococcus luteus]KWW42990.1 hypothetical protein AU359_00142 [Micrococcus luteus]